jgi:hypothetical protein
MIGILFCLGYLLVAFICWFVSMYIILRYKIPLGIYWSNSDELAWSSLTLLGSTIWFAALPAVLIMLFFYSISGIVRFMPWFVRKCFHGDYL